ncbi:MAG: MORN repeat-containing protein [Roseburia sp.]
MNSFFNIIAKAFVRLRTAVMNPFRRILRRIQQIFNVNLITAKLITPINKKIQSIFDVKPKEKDDYITIGIFWISKKLLYFLIMAACASVFLYFTLFAKPIDDTVSSTNVLTTVYFDYDDLDLAEFSGRANIRAANGEVVYTGDIDKGVCTGQGTLWNQDGTLVYEGSFENNKFSGKGTMYYPNKKPKYIGEFEDNCYSGSGISYYQDGTMEYEGEFRNGTFSGEGTLYNENGILVYEGGFENGNLHGVGTSYYENGTKKYEGEFNSGHEHGEGTMYSSTGKKLFTGQFVRGQIQYESLLGAAMSDVLNMCNETPKIYYSNNSTTFWFEGLGLALETNCVVELKKDESLTANGDGWYLPGDEDSEVLPDSEDTSDTASNQTGDTDTSQEEGAINEDSGDSVADDSEQVNLPIISTAGKYNAYYYLETDEWVKEADLDYSKIKVTGLAVANKEFSTDFLKDEVPISANGEADLLECVMIDQLRLEEPTLFSNIQFSQTAKNSNYIKITGINLAEAIYTETYELDNIRYRFCFEADEYEDWKFITMEAY